MTCCSLDHWSPDCFVRELRKLLRNNSRKRSLRNGLFRGACCILPYQQIFRKHIIFTLFSKCFCGPDERRPWFRLKEEIFCIPFGVPPTVWGRTCSTCSAPWATCLLWQWLLHWWQASLPNGLFPVGKRRCRPGLFNANYPMGPARTCVKIAPASTKFRNICSEHK